MPIFFLEIKHVKSPNGKDTSMGTISTPHRSCSPPNVQKNFYDGSKTLSEIRKRLRSSPGDNQATPKD